LTVLKKVSQPISLPVSLKKNTQVEFKALRDAGRIYAEDSQIQLCRLCVFEAIISVIPLCG